MLSEEEKEAIENLNSFKSISILYGNTFTMFLEQLKKYQEATDTILNLIAKLQKENEELIQEKMENIEIINMAKNEMLGYNQGYIDGKNLNASATAQLMRNREYYLFNKQKELLNEKIKKIQKENKEKDKQIDLMLDKIDMTKPIHCTSTNEYSIGRVYMSKSEKKQYFEKLSKEGK